MTLMQKSGEKALNEQSKIVAKGMTGFVLNERYGWYEGKVSDIIVTLDADEDTGNCQVALKAFEGYKTAIPELDGRLKNYVTQMMLTDANEWREDDGKSTVSEQEFAKIIFLTELNFNNDGSLDAYYDDGGIFAGHCIVVGADVNGTITDAYLAG